MAKIKIKNLIFVVALIAFVVFMFQVLCFKFQVLAAEISLDSAPRELGLGQQFQVDLLLSSADEPVNALEGTVLFPNELLSLEEISEANSIVSLWPQKPVLSAERRVVFAGMMPGGYQADKGKIFSLIFETKKEGRGEVGLNEARVLRHDGQGSEADLSVTNFQFSVASSFPSFKFQVSSFKDTEPPETFAPLIAQDPTMFGGKYFLVFTTQDKNSGIDYYEVQETRNKGQVTRDKWLRSESPYVLRDQKLQSYIFVKAVDKAGNERLIMLPPQREARWYENYLIWVIIGGAAILGLVVILLLKWWLAGRKRKRVT